MEGAIHLLHLKTGGMGKGWQAGAVGSAHQQADFSSHEEDLPNSSSKMRGACLKSSEPPIIRYNQAETLLTWTSGCRAGGGELNQVASKVYLSKSDIPMALVILHSFHRPPVRAYHVQALC